MSDPTQIAPLLAALEDLAAWMEASGTPGVVIGGVAASLLGRPRTTRDIDILVIVDESRWQEFLESGAPFRFHPRRADAMLFARRHRVLLVSHEPSGIDVDVVFAALPFEREVIAAAKRLTVAGLAVPVASPEDLIILKAVARRARDLADVEAVLEAHPEVSVDRIRRWLGDFAEALDAPEIMQDWEKILARRGR